MNYITLNLSSWITLFFTQPMGDDSGSSLVSDAAAQGGGATSAAPPIDMMLIVFLVFGGLIILSMFGQRKEKKRKEQMLSSIRKHDEVQTVGGIIGRVSNVSGDKISLKVDEGSNVKMTFRLQSIESIVSSRPNPSDNMKEESDS